MNLSDTRVLAFRARCGAPPSVNGTRVKSIIDDPVTGEREEEEEEEDTIEFRSLPQRFLFIREIVYRWRKEN